MALFDFYGRPLRVGQTVTLPNGQDGLVVELSQLGTKSRVNPKIHVRRLVVVSTAYIEIPLDAPPKLNVKINLEPQDAHLGDHWEGLKLESHETEPPKPQLVTEQ